MNTEDPSADTNPQPDVIGDQNVERLLSKAYQPETLDPAFVERVQDRARAAARQTPSRTATEPLAAQRPLRARAIWFSAATIAASLLLVEKKPPKRRLPSTIATANSFGSTGGLTLRFQPAAMASRAKLSSNRPRAPGKQPHQATARQAASGTVA